MFSRLAKGQKGAIIDKYWVNPELGERQWLDVDRFMPVMDDYYQLRGWDVDTGWLTRERLAQLDLEGVYGDMVAGASPDAASGDARVRLPELPPERPVVDHHRDQEGIGEPTAARTGRIDER